MSHVTCPVSHVMCYVSHVPCHVPHVTCHVSHVFFFLQNGEAYQLRVCYQRGLRRLVLTWNQYSNKTAIISFSMQNIFTEFDYLKQRQVVKLISVLKKYCPTMLAFEGHQPTCDYAHSWKIITYKWWKLAIMTNQSFMWFPI